MQRQRQFLYLQKIQIRKVTNIMNPSELEGLIRQSLDDFYQRRMKKLTELKLSNVLRKKNPYLFRAVGVQKASEIFTKLLPPNTSPSPDTTFFHALLAP